MRSLLFGTDWGSDCDDVVAVRILARAAKENKIKIAGIVINQCMNDSVASLSGFLSCEGITDIKIGIDKTISEENGRYQHRLAKCAPKGVSNADAYDGVRLYREVLSKVENKIEIAEIGFLQVLAGLLTSTADDISDKTGLELVREKVSKIWIMAGKWDEENGKEFNFCHNKASREAADIICEKCPVPITFLGFEIGVDVISGSKLGHDDILYKAMCDHGSENGRSSWDPMLTLLAVTGDEAEAGYDVICGRAHVDSESGENHFEKDDLGLHKYVIRRHEPKYYSDIIDSIIA